MPGGASDCASARVAMYTCRTWWYFNPDGGWDNDTLYTYCPPSNNVTPRCMGPERTMCNSWGE